MMFQVRVCSMATGEQIPLLVSREDGLPLPEMVRYVLNLRDAKRSLSSQRRAIAAVGYGFAYFAQRQIDLDARVAAGQYLTRDELSAFAEFCRRRQKGDGTVSLSHAGVRFRSLMELLLWRSEPIIHRAELSLKPALLELREDFKKRYRSYAPGSANENFMAPGERLGLTPPQRELLLRVIRPGSVENPFDADKQDRNFFLITMLYELPFRGGEALGLKRSDFDFRATPALVTIHRRQDDPEDPRAEKAVAKTRGRALAMGPYLTELAESWINEALRNRTRYPLARTHPYVFVGDHGRPLSLRAFRGIMQRLRQVYPELGAFCAHVLRHTWNDRFIENEEAAGLEPGQTAADQKYANGWDENSVMPELYAKRAIRDSTNRRLLRMQEIQAMLEARRRS